MIKGFKTDLAYYKPLLEWTPAVGDILIYHGWFTHWFGVVNQLNSDNTFDVIKAGLPILLMTMNNTTMKKSTINVDLADVVASSGGKYSAIKCSQNTMIWFI